MMKLFASLLLCLFIPTVWAAGATAPKLDIGKGGQCVEDTQWMRKNHMNVLKHQRDDTVRGGIRGAKYSLKDCIDCHANQKTASVAKDETSFCVSCHSYAAIKIDCFECHSSKSSKLAQGAVK